MDPIDKLLILRDKGRRCYECPLGPFRTKIVFGTGSCEKPPIMFIGEAPGAQEDADGEPFVGRAGKLLMRLLDEVGFSRYDVYITNTVFCRPPNNRNPREAEMAACFHFLRSQIDVVKPRTIVTLGKVATWHLLTERKPIGKMVGHWYDYEGITTMPLYHPSYLLRSPSKTDEFRDDLLRLVRFLADE